jgi:5-carboxymethyl-2-hydroxymuconate isomerase
MPHLILDYSANLEEVIDVQSLCDRLRDAMVESGVFPLGGVRVRALPCAYYSIADGDPSYAYLHMTLRMGHGRDEETRLRVATSLSTVAEAFITPRLKGPFALSLDLNELHPVTSLKPVNSIHDHIKSKGRG